MLLRLASSLAVPQGKRGRICASSSSSSNSSAGWTGVLKLGASSRNNGSSDPNAGSNRQKKKKLDKKTKQAHGSTGSAAVEGQANAAASDGRCQPEKGSPAVAADSAAPHEESKVQCIWQAAVVQVLATHHPPNFVQPWLAGPSGLSSTSTGLVVNAAQRLVLTTAGAVHYAPWDAAAEACIVDVHVPAVDATLRAQVLAVSWEADLALLQLDPLPSSARAAQGAHPSLRASSAAGLQAVSWAQGVPELGQPVFVAGFAARATWSPGLRSQAASSQDVGLCVSKGVTSRVEVVRYSHSGRRLLAIQVDAAVNAGSWGGGVFDHQGRCLGVLLQRSPEQPWQSRYCSSDTDSLAGVGPRDAIENVAHVIPPVVISHFLSDLKNHRGAVRGYPSLGFNWQPLHSPALQQYLGITHGVRVCTADPAQPEWGACLQPGDVVTHLDGQAVSCGGCILLTSSAAAAAAAAAPAATSSEGAARSSSAAAAKAATANSGWEVCMSHIAAMKQVGDLIEVRVLRQGRPIIHNIRLSAPRPLAPPFPPPQHTSDGGSLAAAGGVRVQFQDPDHVFLGPFAFVAATQPLIQQLLRPPHTQAVSASALMRALPSEPGQPVHVRPVHRSEAMRAPAHPGGDGGGSGGAGGGQGLQDGWANWGGAREPAGAAWQGELGALEGGLAMKVAGSVGHGGAAVVVRRPRLSGPRGASTKWHIMQNSVKAGERDAHRAAITSCAAQDSKDAASGCSQAALAAAASSCSGPMQARVQRPHRPANVSMHALVAAAEAFTSHPGAACTAAGGAVDKAEQQGDNQRHPGTTEQCGSYHPPEQDGCPSGNSPVVTELVVLAGLAPRRRRYTSSSGGTVILTQDEQLPSEQGPRGEQKEEAYLARLLSELPAPRLLRTFNGVEVLSCEQLTQLVAQHALHSLGTAELQFACGSVLVVPLPARL